jgi:hypothetical protein
MVAAENELFSAVRAARDAGASWAGIGAAALLTSQQRAAKPGSQCHENCRNGTKQERKHARCACLTRVRAL